MQRPAMQRLAMQRPAMQRPAMQRPAMQRPAMQRPAMQRPAMQRPPRCAAILHPDMFYIWAHGTSVLLRVRRSIRSLELGQRLT
ncbi:Serum response factor-binding protein 1 [Liparis tanakae]|uniref:Serum response factor-binding protein 1 n=1 Tax=Liparis tanakae TaxID=230148 RepID=A0A4Z2EJF0_9TELE|nr:Serum response factor-binding protein 1 [Liparis tanakae]